LKNLSFEDSQIDHYVPYSSPYILCWHNKKYNNNENNTLNYSNLKNSDNTDISFIEKARGNIEASSKLTQISAGFFSILLL
jgi:hypothetical protein